MAGPSCDTITRIYTLTDPLLSCQPRGIRLMPPLQTSTVRKPTSGFWPSIETVGGSTSTWRWVRRRH
jgi:hypothetical protein